TADSWVHPDSMAPMGPRVNGGRLAAPGAAVRLVRRARLGRQARTAPRVATARRAWMAWMGGRASGVLPAVAARAAGRPLAVRADPRGRRVLAAVMARRAGWATTAWMASGVRRGATGSAAPRGPADLAAARKRGRPGSKAIQASRVNGARRGR